MWIDAAYDGLARVKMGIVFTSFTRMDMTIRYGIIFCGVLLLFFPQAGCAPSPSAPFSSPASREQIGEIQYFDATGLDDYETAVVGLLNNMTDAIILMASVENPASSIRLADMIEAATPSFVAMRQQMKDQKESRQITDIELVLKYGSQYLWATLEYRQQMDRIEELGPEVHGPMRAAIDQLKEALKEAGLPTKPD